VGRRKCLQNPQVPSTVSQEARSFWLVQRKHVRVPHLKSGVRECDILRHYRKKYKMGLTSYRCWAKITEWLKILELFPLTLHWEWIISSVCMHCCKPDSMFYVMQRKYELHVDLLNSYPGSLWLFMQPHLVEKKCRFCIKESLKCKMIFLKYVL
jgi:hypothetical protein